MAAGKVHAVAAKVARILEDFTPVQQRNVLTAASDPMQVSCMLAAVQIHKALTSIPADAAKRVLDFTRGNLGEEAKGHGTNG